MALTDYQLGRIKRAREALELSDQPAPRGIDTTDRIMRLAEDVGRLRFWLDDMLGLVAEVDGGQK